MSVAPARRTAPGVAEGLAYAEAVCEGHVSACDYVRLACGRFLADYDAAMAGQGEWAFRADLAELATEFAGLLRNIKGPEANRPLRLMPWQRMVFCNLFGFIERGTYNYSVPGVLKNTID